MYQIVQTDGNEMIRWDDNSVIRFIPMDPANTDYQQYLEWLAEGNEPEVIAP